MYMSGYNCYIQSTGCVLDKHTKKDGILKSQLFSDIFFRYGNLSLKKVDMFLGSCLQ